MSWKRRETCITAPFLQFNLLPVLTVPPQWHFLIQAPFPCLNTITICSSWICGVLKRDRYEENFRDYLVQTVVWQDQIHLCIEIFFLFCVLEGRSVFSGYFSSLCLFFSSFHLLSKWQKWKGNWKAKNVNIQTGGHPLVYVSGMARVCSSLLLLSFPV